FYGDHDTVAGDGLFKIQDRGLALIKKINTSGKSHIQSLLEYGEKAVFAACDATNGCEPWITDGTTEGTRLIANINALGDSNPGQFTLFMGEVYFTADDGKSGVELWKTDGTNAGTVMVENIGLEEAIADPPPVSSTPGELTVFNGALYFTANDIDFGVELWKTDGTNAGTVMVKNIGLEEAVADPAPVSGNPHDLTVFNGALYFVADDGPFAELAYGEELWKTTDGTTANTSIVMDIGVDPGDPTLAYDGSPQKFFIYDNNLYFFADDGGNGFEPWRTNGATTVMVANIGAGAFPTDPVKLTYWTAFAGRLFLTADNGTDGLELWSTDGSGATMLINLNSAGDGVVANRDDVFRIFNNQLFFFGNDGSRGYEPWATNGSPGSAAIVLDLRPGSSPTDAAGLAFLTTYQDRLYFTADDGSKGTEIWTTAGTGTETSVLKDIAPGGATGYRDTFGPYELDGTLYFSAYDGLNNHGVEMWRTMGSEIETQLVEDLNPGTADGVLLASPLPLL
ncbi:MAG: hypothetical protein OEL80_07835, partial [Desulfuromonadales bacterium]|nr:hypothetical protein [Desulfuromonadales bacterium]